MMMEKKSFDVALTEQYGLLIGVDKNSTKNILKALNINQINNFLDKIVDCEISLKKESNRNVAIFEKLLIGFV